MVGQKAQQVEKGWESLPMRMILSAPPKCLCLYGFK